ncbi:MAG: hypothetical protein UU99_C0001G0226 [Parcubacteria group bacterium GW2011_GWE2_42_14]|nr:MAG: hypothetical protein UU99_C0001G0226 [Parcubacteria group bacterium GW2011_GWE2_42_14]
MQSQTWYKLEVNGTSNFSDSVQIATGARIKGSYNAGTLIVQAAQANDYGARLKLTAYAGNALSYFNLIGGDAQDGQNVGDSTVKAGNAGVLVGGHLKISGGNGYTGGGVASGGHVYLDGGTAYGTGIAGNVLLQTLVGGNVGIGTTTPWARLSVAGSGVNDTTPAFAISDLRYWDDSTWGSSSGKSY